MEEAEKAKESAASAVANLKKETDFVDTLKKDKLEIESIEKKSEKDAIRKDIKYKVNKELSGDSSPSKSESSSKEEPASDNKTDIKAKVDAVMGGSSSAEPAPATTESAAPKKKKCKPKTSSSDSAPAKKKCKPKSINDKINDELKSPAVQKAIDNAGGQATIDVIVDIDKKN